MTMEAHPQVAGNASLILGGVAQQVVHLILVLQQLAAHQVRLLHGQHMRHVLCNSS